MEEYPHFVKDSLEADDCMGILATKFPGRCVIVTIDKDMKTIPGRMLHLKQQSQPEWLFTTEADANFAWLSQSISGDRTDGYPGIEGMGPAKSAKLLHAKGAVYKTVEDAYIAAGLTKEDALMNTRMARILRAEDWDFAKSEMKLWTP
jgi:DNA polymerase-1